MLDVGSIVKVVWHPPENPALDREGNIKPFRIMYDNRVYDLKPDGDTFIPFEAAMLWFGDPRSGATVSSYTATTGVRGWIADRETEVRRLRSKYGAFAGAEDEIPGAPNVEVYDLEGEQVYTVLDDPLGEGVIQAAPTLAEKAGDQARMDQMQRQIDMLMARLAGEGGVDLSTVGKSQTVDEDADPDDDGEGGGEDEPTSSSPPVDEFGPDSATAPSPVPSTAPSTSPTEPFPEATIPDPSMSSDSFIDMAPAAGSEPPTE